MKAILLYEKRDGATELRDVPEPRAGPGDIIIKVKAAAICGADIEFFRARLTSILEPPVILGHEFCGVVEEAGEKVTGWKPGDRVVSEGEQVTEGWYDRIGRLSETMVYPAMQ